MQPEFRQLRAFLAVADQGSANRAGAALFRAQSAVSRSIHKLESELGVALFERRARGMLMTEYGRALLVRARRVQAECNARAPSSRRSQASSPSAGADLRHADARATRSHLRRVGRAASYAVGRREPRHHAACRQHHGARDRGKHRRSAVRTDGARHDTSARGRRARVAVETRARRDAPCRFRHRGAARGRARHGDGRRAAARGRTRLLPESIRTSLRPLF